MSKITTEDIKELRNTTGVSVMQCKKALEKAEGDSKKALVILRKQSASVALKKEGRELKSGTIQSYVHSNGLVASMVELSCETDFVARNDEFKSIAYDIAMHVAAQNPEYLEIEKVPEEAKKSALEVFTKEVSDKPKEMREKILEGKMKSYLAEKSLLEQAFIKDPNLTIKNLIDGAIQKFGEKIEVRRIERFAVLE